MSKMHTDEILLTIAQVQKMIQEQFPKWVDLPIQSIQSAGTVNTIYKLGAEYCIRIPKRNSGVEQIEKESQYLSLLAQELPLNIPSLIEIGKPCSIYPLKWSVYRWIEGENAIKTKLKDIPKNIEILAQFIKALQKVTLTHQLHPGSHNYYRGEPLINRDEQTRATIHKLKDIINVDIATKVWEAALDCPMLVTEKKWIHGDLQSGNILAKNGQITAIIDFGALGVGDMACDLMPAWNLFNAQERALFKRSLSVEESVWTRARGWSLTVAVVALEYYMHTNPGLAEISRYTIKEIEKEYE